MTPSRVGSVGRPEDYLASCDQDGAAKYLLGPAIIEGTQIGGAAAGTTSDNAEWLVSLDFKAQG